MNARVVLVALLSGLLVVAAVLWSAPGAAAEKAPSFIELGQVYDFHSANATLTGAVLEIGSDGWIKIKERSSGKIGWVNLALLWGIKQPG